MSREALWKACLVAAAILSVLTFTPLVIPTGEYRPMLGGVPLTLWTGVLLAFAYVALTWIVGKVHPEMTAHSDESAGSRIDYGMTENKEEVAK